MTRTGKLTSLRVTQPEDSNPARQIVGNGKRSFSFPEASKGFLTFRRVDLTGEDR